MNLIQRLIIGGTALFTLATAKAELPPYLVGNLDGDTKQDTVFLRENNSGSYLDLHTTRDGLLKIDGLNEIAFKYQLINLNTQSSKKSLVFSRYGCNYNNPYGETIFGDYIDLYLFDLNSKKIRLIKNFPITQGRLDLWKFIDYNNDQNTDLFFKLRNENVFSMFLPIFFNPSIQDYCMYGDGKGNFKNPIEIK